jgi:hypothetical protein
LHDSSPHADATLVTAWIVANVFGLRTRTAGTTPALGFPSTPSDRAALALWTCGSAAGVAMWSVLWIPIALRLRADPPSMGSGAAVLALAAVAAFGCALVVWVFHAVLPRAAAVAASGGWLLLAWSAPISSPSSQVAAEIAFPLSRLLATADEAARVGGTLRALGSAALFDVGVLALLVAIELRRPRRSSRK